MFYQFIRQDGFIEMRLEGDVDLIDWQKCLMELDSRRFSLQCVLIDGRGLRAFNLNHAECQVVAGDFVNFLERAVFLSADPLIFGMMRIIQSYADNDRFRVVKTLQQALDFLGIDRTYA